jgi:hypothetical protein
MPQYGVRHYKRINVTANANGPLTHSVSPLNCRRTGMFLTFCSGCVIYAYRMSNMECGSDCDESVLEHEAHEAAKDLDQLQEQLLDYHSTDREVSERMLNTMARSAADEALANRQNAARNTAPSNGANTGPKGVITDYKEAKQKMIAKMERDRIKAWQSIEQHSFTVASDNNDDTQQEDEEARLEREMMLAEEAFLKEYDDHWSRELQRRQAASTAEMLPGLSKDASVPATRRFGSVASLGRDSFVEFIDQELPHTTVIIHLYQNSNRSCLRMRQVLHDLSRSYPSVKFGEMLSTHAQLSFDDLALPALLIYKGGSLMESFVRITEDIGFNFDFDDLESFLVECVELFPLRPAVALRLISNL